MLPFYGGGGTTTLQQLFVSMPACCSGSLLSNRKTSLKSLHGISVLVLTDRQTDSLTRSQTPHDERRTDIDTAHHQRAIMTTDNDDDDGGGGDGGG